MFLNSSIKKSLTIITVPLLFLIIGIITLSDYGINWDEPFHFNRGQSYLHFYLTGRKNYLDLPAYPLLKGTSDFVDRKGESDLYLNAKRSEELANASYRRSYYQSDVFNIDNFFSEHDGGHPPISDILASFFNLIFYQKLNIFGDIESYHLYEIFVSTMLIFGVAIFVYKNFGLLATITSSLALSLYPLFFAESHFNIKDPTEASFFALSLICIYFGISYKRSVLIISSAFLAGLALGTKFNALFLPFIIIPWLIFRFLTHNLNFNDKLMFTFIAFPLLAGFILFIFWPFLWQDTSLHLLKVINYYKQIGLGTPDDLKSFIFFGFNVYPLIWIIFTTPLSILILSILGLIYAIYFTYSKRSDLTFLILLWFLIPIIRVIAPETNIYGGVRQIMEYIPAMAVLSGLGVLFIINVLKISNGRKRNIFTLVLVLSFIFTGWELVRIHPNQNVYFNQLIGGLNGAKEKNIPSWGNSYGNAYLQGVNWLNANAEPNAKVGLPIANMVNVPRIKLRSDISFSNKYPSGPKMQGEYIMEMSHDWAPKSWYGYTYYEKFLEPVYEVKVEGISILKIWKNDIGHVKKAFRVEKEYKVLGLQKSIDHITINLEKEIILTKLIIDHSVEDCIQKQIGGYVRISSDGVNWTQEPENIDYPQIPVQWLESNERRFVYLFPAKNAKYIYLNTEINNSCILKNPDIKIFGLDNNSP